MTAQANDNDVIEFRRRMFALRSMAPPEWETETERCKQAWRDKFVRVGVPLAEMVFTSVNVA